MVVDRDFEGEEAGRVDHGEGGPAVVLIDVDSVVCRRAGTGPAFVIGGWREGFEIEVEVALDAGDGRDAAFIT